MQVWSGRSVAEDAASAVAEATADWHGAPELVLAFCSTAQDPELVAAGLAERFPGVPVVGCTTSGEHLDGEHSRGSLVLTGIGDAGIRWAHASFDLRGFDAQRAEALVQALFAETGVDPDDPEPERCFALLLVDGLSLAEERVASTLAEALQGVPLAGGSAGDDLRFAETRTLCDGRARSGQGVLVLGRCLGSRVRVLKHQHFHVTPRALAVTRADPGTRTVFELDGRPAVEAYAEALGVAREQITPSFVFEHPVTLTVRGRLYVRSVQAIGEDGSLRFYCAVEEGMVVQIAGHEDQVAALAREAADERFDLVIGFNCILRALEADAGGLHAPLGAELRKLARHSILFDTYGEQLDGLHINQTLVMVGLTDTRVSA